MRRNNKAQTWSDMDRDYARQSRFSCAPEKNEGGGLLADFLRIGIRLAENPQYNAQGHYLGTEQECNKLDKKGRNGNARIFCFRNARRNKGNNKGDGRICKIPPA